MTQRHHISWEQLITKYSDNSISKEELELMLKMADACHDLDGLAIALKDHWEKTKGIEEGREMEWDEKFEQLLIEVKQAVPDMDENKKKNHGWTYLIAAAIALLVILGGVIAYNLVMAKPVTGSEVAKVSQPSGDVEAPKDTRAVITLANGQKVFLDSVGKGTLATEGAVNVVKTIDGRIVYNASAAVAGSQVQYNTLFNPRGSKVVNLTLSDGTKVWLNSESSLRYPVVFTGNERKVEITGEAYFDVAAVTTRQGNKMSFGVDILSTGGGAAKGRIEVLGTHFNVNAYDEEAMVKTTLLEGSVSMISGGRQDILRPGQQAQLIGDRIRMVDNVDTDAVIAWKNGFFSFGQTDLASLMRQIGRWYNVEIEYAGKVPDRRFGGEISRDTKVSQVLKVLEESNVHFRIEGKKITVLP